MQCAVAVAAAVLLLTCGVLGLSHEADGAHVRDPRTGAMLHGHALSGMHVDSAQSDVHGRADDHDADAGVCALDVVIHQAVIASATFVLHAAPAPAASVPTIRIVTRAPALASVLRDAPKTSPPVRA